MVSKQYTLRKTFDEKKFQLLVSYNYEKANSLQLLAFQCRTIISKHTNSICKEHAMLSYENLLGCNLEKLENQAEILHFLGYG